MRSRGVAGELPGDDCARCRVHRTIPELTGSNATIERNKIITKNRVSREMDLWVCVNPGTIYETSHILECKSWQRPVGTDEVFKLAGKMKALHGLLDAVHGVFEGATFLVGLRHQFLF